jgi:hypothetical protein
LYVVSFPILVWLRKPWPFLVFRTYCDIVSGITALYIPPQKDHLPKKEKDPLVHHQKKASKCWWPCLQAMSCANYMTHGEIPNDFQRKSVIAFIKPKVSLCGRDVWHSSVTTILDRLRQRILAAPQILDIDRKWIRRSSPCPRTMNM